MSTFPYQYAQAVKLLDNLSADGTGEPVVLWADKKYSFLLAGTLGGGNVTLEVSVDQNTWVTIKNSDYSPFTVTQTFLFFCDLSKGLFIRAILAGSTTPTGVNLYIM